MSLLTELRNRGVGDTFIVCCDGLKGLPDAIRATWPLAEVQLCVVHLVDLEHWPDEPEIVERVGLPSCRRRTAAIDLILGRSNLGVYRW